MAQRPPRRHGNVVGWGPIVNDTRLEEEGGSCHQVCHDTHHPDQPVHVGGQSSVSTSNHTMAPREVAHWTPTGWIHPQGIAEVGALRAGYSAGGHGFLLLLDTDRWAHPWVATTGRGSGHWTLGHGNVEFVQGWREVIRARASGETTPGQHRGHDTNHSGCTGTTNMKIRCPGEAIL